MEIKVTAEMRCDLNDRLEKEMTEYGHPTSVYAYDTLFGLLALKVLEGSK